MKFKGIIPELKFSEGSNQVGYYLRCLEPYRVVSINTSSLFNGDLDFLRGARQMYPDKFIIRKDFIIIPKQVEESKEAGADAVLLIRDLLPKKQYHLLMDACEKFEIIPITEINSPHYMKEEDVVLVNSRDLNTGQMDGATAREICAVYKKQYGNNVIYASGESSDEVVREGIADAVLIGTAFMQGKLKC